MKELTLQAIRNAAERIKPYTVHTPMLEAFSLEDKLGCKVYIKPETLQVSGSFKMRGATNRILSLTEEERKKGIICCSSGNHGKACATVGKLTGTKVVIVLPDDIQVSRMEKMQSLGSQVLLGGKTYPECWEKVYKLVVSEGYTVVHPYEDYEIMAGQGTVGLEIMDDLPGVDTIFVPIGGGGLIAGIATAAKAIKPDVKIVGIQPKASNPYVLSMEAGHPVEIPMRDTLADGLKSSKPGKNPYPIIEKKVDLLVSVEEEAIAEAVRLVAEEIHLVAEPSSCVGIAALLSGVYQPEKDEKICFVLTAGNWDIVQTGKLLAGEI